MKNSYEMKPYNAALAKIKLVLVKLYTGCEEN